VQRLGTLLSARLAGAFSEMAALLALAAILAPAFGAPQPASEKARTPVAARLAALHLPEPLVATGPTSPAEDAGLLVAARRYQDRANSDDYSALTGFLAAYPRSAWRVAVLTNLGISYRHNGYFSRALTAFADAWQAGKDAEGRGARALVDRAVGELVELDADFGYRDRLAALLDEIADRPISGSATEMIQEGRETLWVMQTDPKHLYLCGPAALRMLMLSRHASLEQVDFLDKMQAGPKGTSLEELAALARAAHLAYEPVFRAPGEPVPVPSIVHWRVGHFAAIIGARDGRFEVHDPTFGRQSLWLTKAAIDAEASGYFLASAKEAQIASWRPLDERQASQVWGTGKTKKKKKGRAKNPPAKNKKKDCPLCDYDIGELAVSLTLVDRPVGYVPPKGPSAKIEITYNQREDVQPANFDYFNVGPKWTFNWVTYIRDDPSVAGGSVMLYRPDGDADFFTGYDRKTGNFAPDESDASLLVLVEKSPVVYRRYLQDGTVLTYAQSDDSRIFPRNVFLSEIADPQGNTLRLDYDKTQGRVRLASLIDAAGRTTRFSYDLPGSPLLVTRITDPFGRHADLAYDRGNLASITDVIGLQSQFTYDAASEITSLKTPYGTTNFTFGGTGNRRFVNVIDPLKYGEREESFMPAPVPFSDPVAPTLPANGGYAPYFNQYLNYRDSFFWNKHAYTVAHCTPSGGCDYADARITHFDHDADDINTEWDSIESRKEPLENRVWFNYPGQPICPGPPNCGLGAGASGTYDSPTAIARVLDTGETQLTQIAYNDAGNPTRYIDPGGRETTVAYAPNEIDPVAVSQVTAHGPETVARMTYDDRHLPLTFTDAAGRTTRYAYNAAGQLINMTNALGQETRYAYNGTGDLTQITNADGKVAASFTYGRRNDDVASYTDAGGWTVRYDYDAADRLTRATYPDGTTEEYGYFRLDLVSYKDREGRVWKYDFDADRRLVSVTDPLHHVTKYAYYEDGTQKAITDANGHTTSWDIDVESRPIAKHFADGTVTTYDYEYTTSRLKFLTDALGQTKYYTYTVDDRPAGITYFGALHSTPSVAFTYDPYFPRLTQMTDGTGTTHYGYVPIGALGALQLQAEASPLPNGRISYDYDALGRIVGRTVGGAAPERFEYDKIGRLIAHDDALGKFALSYLGETLQPKQRGLVSGGVTTSWSYLSDADDRRLKSIVNTPGRTFDYTTTPEELIKTIVEKKSASVVRQWDFRYDDDYRLVNAGSSSGQTYGYGLDPGGNITAFRTPIGSEKATYDAVNELTDLTGKPFVYDADGNLTSDGVRRYAWDAENRLIAIDQGGTRVDLAYDGRGRRIAIATTKSGRTTVTDYLWCGWRICQARSAPGIVERLYYDEGEAIPAAKAFLYYGLDQLGSVRDVHAKSPIFSITQEYDYDPYGNALKIPPDGPFADFRYGGMFYEANSGLYLTQYRAYDPRIGRWLSRDPMEEQAGTNLYAYVEGNPVVRSDPQGLGGVSVGPGGSGEGSLQIGCCVSIGPGGVSVGLGPVPVVNIPWNGRVQLPLMEIQLAIPQLQNAYSNLSDQLLTLQNLKCQNTPKYKDLAQKLKQLAGLINSLMWDANTLYSQNYQNQWLTGTLGPNGTPGPIPPGGYPFAWGGPSH
jgi:RHS repeat-associated protein